MPKQEWHYHPLNERGVHMRLLMLIDLAKNVFQVQGVDDQGKLYCVKNGMVQISNVLVNTSVTNQALISPDIRATVCF